MPGPRFREFGQRRSASPSSCSASTVIRTECLLQCLGSPFWVTKSKTGEKFRSHKKSTARRLCRQRPHPRHVDRVSKTRRSMRRWNPTFAQRTRNHGAPGTRLCPVRSSQRHLDRVSKSRRSGIPRLRRKRANMGHPAPGRRLNQRFGITRPKFGDASKPRARWPTSRSLWPGQDCCDL